jgi:hypothetical protein
MYLLLGKEKKCLEETEQDQWVKDQAQAEEWDSEAREVAGEEEDLEQARSGSAFAPDAAELFNISRACPVPRCNALPVAQ